jgi:hypothetical protein
MTEAEIKEFKFKRSFITYVESTLFTLIRDELNKHIPICDHSKNGVSCLKRGTFETIFGGEEEEFVCDICLKGFPIINEEK